MAGADSAAPQPQKGSRMGGTFSAFIHQLVNILVNKKKALQMKTPVRP